MRRNEHLILHDQSGTPTYSSYDHMRARCLITEGLIAKSYYEKGITVCDRWKEDNGKGYENFLEDMGERPEGTSIDRIDNDKGYYKENCRWSSKSEQNYNRKSSLKNKSGSIGVMMKKKTKTWRAYISKDGVRIELGHYKTFQQACEVREAAEREYYGEIYATKENSC
jgi:hypothetical protein